MQKRILILLSGVLVIAGLAFTFLTLYKDATRRLNKRTVRILKETSRKYFAEEYQKLNSVAFGSKPLGLDSLSHHVVKQLSRKATTLSGRSKGYPNLSNTLEDKRNQFVVLNSGSFIIDSLRIRWEQALSGEGITADNAIRMFRLKPVKKQYLLSCSRSFAFDSSYDLGDFRAGWQDDFLVEPFVHYSTFTALKANHQLVWLSVGGVVLIICLVLYRRQIRLNKQPEDHNLSSIDTPVESSDGAEAVVPANGEASCADPSCYSCADLSYNESRDTFMLNGEVVIFRPQLHRLFSLFIKSPDCYLTREEIKNTFWEKKEIANDDVRQLIANARICLRKSNSRLTIKRMHDNFYLEIDESSCQDVTD